MSNLKWPSVSKRSEGNFPGGKCLDWVFSRRELSYRELSGGNCPCGVVVLWEFSGREFTYNRSQLSSPMLFGSI